MRKAVEKSKRRIGMFIDVIERRYDPEHDGGAVSWIDERVRLAIAELLQIAELQTVVIERQNELIVAIANFALTPSVEEHKKLMEMIKDSTEDENAPGIT